MSDAKNFKVHVTGTKAVIECDLCVAERPFTAVVIDITNRSLQDVLEAAEAHTMVAHSEQHETSDAWKDATDPVNNSSGPGPLDELSEAAERAVRAAASEVLPLLTKWFTKPR